MLRREEDVGTAITTEHDEYNRTCSLLLHSPVIANDSRRLEDRLTTRQAPGFTPREVDIQPTPRYLRVIPSRDNMRPRSQNQVKMIGENRHRENSTSIPKLKQGSPNLSTTTLPNKGLLTPRKVLCPCAFTVPSLCRLPMN